MSALEYSGLFLFCAVVVALAMIIVRRRRVARIMGTPVLIGEAMRSKGITPADAEAAGPDQEVFDAARRCASCAVDSACRILLSQGPGNDVPAECPNRKFFAKVAAHKKSRETDSPLHSSKGAIG